MARKTVSNADLIAASKEIVAANNGNMGFDEWKAALNAKFETNLDPNIAALLKKKTFVLFLDGTQENGLPNLRVLNELPTREA